VRTPRATSRAHAALDRGRDEARAFNHVYLDTGHLLLDLTVVQDGLAARILSYFGLLQTVTGETMRVIGIASTNR